MTPVEFAAAFTAGGRLPQSLKLFGEVCLFVLSLFTADAAEPITGPTTVVSYREDKYTFTGG